VVQVLQNIVAQMAVMAVVVQKVEQEQPQHKVELVLPLSTVTLGVLLQTLLEKEALVEAEQEHRDQMYQVHKMLVVEAV
jgi:hypothetical protein